MTPDELRALAKSVHAAKEYADEIVKPPLAELGGILSDTVGYWRLRNKARLLLKAKKYIEARGIDPTKMLPDVFVPLIEEASNTDDETLSEMFARLLESHLDPEGQQAVHPTFAKILGQLSALDAQIMWAITENQRKAIADRLERAGKAKPPVPSPKREPFGTVNVKELIQSVVPGLNGKSIILSLWNLQRLGLCATDLRIDQPPTGSEIGCRAPLACGLLQTGNILVRDRNARNGEKIGGNQAKKAGHREEGTPVEITRQQPRPPSASGTEDRRVRWGYWPRCTLGSSPATAVPRPRPRG